LRDLPHNRCGWGASRTRFASTLAPRVEADAAAAALADSLEALLDGAE
jgi:hypothetical protein